MKKKIKKREYGKIDAAICMKNRKKDYQKEYQKNYREDKKSQYIIIK